MGASGGDALGAIKLPDTAGAAGRGEGNVVMLAWSGGAAGCGGAVGNGVVRKNGGVDLSELGCVELRQCRDGVGVGDGVGKG